MPGCHKLSSRGELTWLPLEMEKNLDSWPLDLGPFFHVSLQLWAQGLGCC